MRALMPCGSYN